MHLLTRSSACLLAHYLAILTATHEQPFAGIGQGILVALSSYNQKSNQVKNALLTTLLNSFASLMCGFVGTLSETQLISHSQCMLSLW